MVDSEISGFVHINSNKDVLFKKSPHGKINIYADKFFSMLKYDDLHERNFEEFYQSYINEFFEVLPKDTVVNLLKVKEPLKSLNYKGDMDYFELYFDVISKFRKNGPKKFNDSDYFDKFNEIYNESKEYIKSLYLDDVNDSRSYIDTDYYVQLNMKKTGNLAFDRSAYMYYSVFFGNMCQIIDEDGRYINCFLIPFPKFVYALQALYMWFL